MGGVKRTTHHHASQSSISGHGQVPDCMTSVEFGVAEHDQQRRAASKARAHGGAHRTPGHHLNTNTARKFGEHVASLLFCL